MFWTLFDVYIPFLWFENTQNYLKEVLTTLTYVLAYITQEKLFSKKCLKNLGKINHKKCISSINKNKSMFL